MKKKLKSSLQLQKRRDKLY